jgi:hypothetical protein
MKSLDMLRKRRMQGRGFPPGRNCGTKPVEMPSMSELQARVEGEGWRENTAALTLEAHPSSGTTRNSLISISTIGSAANLNNGADPCHGVEMTDDEDEGGGGGHKKSLTLRI